MEPPTQLLEALTRFTGQRALIVDSGHDRYLAGIARRFEQVDAISVAHERNMRIHGASAPANVTRLVWQPGDFPFADGTFDAVFLLHATAGVLDPRQLLRESLRTLKQRGELVIVEADAHATTEQQTIMLELERLMHDRDGALTEHTPVWLTVDELRAELRNLDLHHARVTEYTPEDYGLDSVGRQLLKRESLERLKVDLLPALSRLGSRRNEFERRLIDLKRRIEVVGVSPLNVVMIHGLKKTAYATSETSLFAGEIFAPDAGMMRFEMKEDDLPIPTLTGSAGIALDSLGTPELLSLIMTGGESSSRLEKLAKRVLSEYGSRAVADERNPDALVETLGISATRASQIVAAFELGRRFFASPDDDAPILRGPEDIFRYVSDMAKLRREQFRGLYLNNRNRLVADEVIAIGTLTSAVIHPREVFRPALTHHAVSVIIVHNHPSGDPEPSPEDIELTRQLHQAGQILGMELLDHVVVGGDSWFSMRDADLF
jgi:DNA repair protein RadC